VAFETETYTGAYAFIKKLIEQFVPDYIVGSVHHVRDIPIDYSTSLYQQAAGICGGSDQLYCEYFDLQYEMIRTLKPLVVGHFDLIRLFDADYVSRLQEAKIQAKIRRNLKLIKDLGLILDFNLRALCKGAAEPYISRSILEVVRSSDIAIVPGDDSHGMDTAGLNVDKGIRILQEVGFDYDVRRVLKLLSVP
jgi:histidinol-phosphatase (PHP family)